MVEFNFSKPKAGWSHASITEDGVLNVFFKDSEHASMDMNDLKGTNKAALVNVIGAIVKACAENRETGSSTGVTEKIIRDKFQADNTARMDSNKEIESE